MITRQASHPDPLTQEQRRRCMAANRGRDTRPEMILRKGLHARGLRYRVQGRDLPGRPDLVFPARKAVIFVNGCFWHGHDCPLFKAPASNAAFWVEKIATNRSRDQVSNLQLRADGWRVLSVWECAMRGRRRLPPGAVVNRAEAFLRGDAVEVAIEGEEHG